MLMPRRVKYRKQQRGRMSGIAKGGSTIAFGDYALMTGNRAIFHKTGRAAFAVTGLAVGLVRDFGQQAGPGIARSSSN